jgi:toxin ParE1/3/4
VTTIHWTDQAIADLAAIRAFIQQDSPHYASVVVARLIRAVARLRDFRQSGRVVPEFERSAVREIVERPYRIIYRLVRDDEVHILTVHHDGQYLPMGAGWTPEFLEGLHHVDDDTVEAVDDMLEDMKQARRSNPARDPCFTFSTPTPSRRS